MNISELRAELGRKKLSIPKLANLIGMDKKTLYTRFNEKTAFTQPEISAISEALSLSDDRILEIFFASQVS